MNVIDATYAEAEAWWDRNRHKINNKDDLVLKILDRNNPPASNIVEIGCANGWRLHELKQRNQRLKCVGYDISFSALTEGRANYKDIQLYYGSGDQLRYSEDGEYDIVIMGFFLYLVERENLFRIVMEADRVLSDHGHLVILDFIAGWPHAVAYKHNSNLRCYKMNYAGLWTANPAYRCLDSIVDVKNEYGTWLLQKSFDVWRDTCELESSARAP